MLNPFKTYTYSIRPYVKDVNNVYLFVFDDEARGLKEEPLEIGITSMIIFLLELSRIKSDTPFTLTFSNKPLFNSVKLTKVIKENDGTWYACLPFRLSGWLCPALFKYFYFAPKYIYVNIKADYDATQRKAA